MPKRKAWISALLRRLDDALSFAGSYLICSKL